MQSHLYLAGLQKPDKERHQEKKMRQATDESSPETVGVAAPTLSVGASSPLPSDDASADAAGLFLQCDQHAEVECEPTRTGPNVVP